MKRKARKRTLAIGSWGALFLFMSLTSPQDLTVGAIMIPAMLFFLASSLSCYWLVEYLGIRLPSNNSRLILSTLVGGVPTLLLMLKSINQLTVKDAMLLVIISAVSLTYIKRFRLIPKMSP